MNVLLIDLDPSQELLLATVDEARRVDGAWPIWQYVDRTLYREHQLDAREVLLTLPRVAHPSIGGYGLVWVGTPHHMHIEDAEVIGLTVAGMVHVKDDYDVDLFMRTVEYMITRDRELAPSPREVHHVQVSSAELAEVLGRERPPFRLRGASLAQLSAILSNEPVTWGGQLTPDPNDPTSWEVRVSPHIRRFKDVVGVSEYLDCVVELMTPPSTSTPSHPSSLALPEAIDYLNAVWRVRHGTPLVTIRRVDAAAKLGLDCATADEFDARLSALCAILDDLHLPDDSIGKLIGLDDYLNGTLAPDAAARTHDAIADLRALFGLRAWRQHPNASDRVHTAKLRLGIQLPPSDWASAWTELQVRAVNALNALREEIEDAL